MLSVECKLNNAQVELRGDKKCLQNMFEDKLQPEVVMWGNILHLPAFFSATLEKSSQS